MPQEYTGIITEPPDNIVCWMLVTNSVNADSNGFGGMLGCICVRIKVWGALSNVASKGSGCLATPEV